MVIFLSSLEMINTLDNYLYFDIYYLYIDSFKNMETPLFNTRELTLQQEVTTETLPSSQIPIYKPTPEISLQNVLNRAFPKQSEENKFTRTRHLLGETAKTLSNEQLETSVTEFQFLIDTWLNEYEKDVFKGLTLKEVINEP